MKKVYYVLAALMLMAVFIAGCSQQEQADNVAPIQETDNAAAEGVQDNELSEAAEMLSCTYASVDELAAHIKEASLTETVNPTEESVDLSEITYFYAPDTSSFSGYRLFQIEVLPDYIIYYFTPSDTEVKGFSYDTGITVTYCRNADITLSSLSSQLGLEISDDGFLYDSDRGDISFVVESSVMTIHVPKSLNNYEYLKSICSVEKITIE